MTLDYGRCIFCGLCAEAATDGTIRITAEVELAAQQRSHLVSLGALPSGYVLEGNSSSRLCRQGPAVARKRRRKSDCESKIRRVLGRSLQIREVDAGSCNGCEVEITGLNSPIYDAERLGIRFVASPRHADMLLVQYRSLAIWRPRSRKRTTQLRNPAWWWRREPAVAVEESLAATMPHWEELIR